MRPTRNRDLIREIREERHRAEINEVRKLVGVRQLTRADYLAMTRGAR